MSTGGHFDRLLFFALGIFGPNIHLLITRMAFLQTHIGYPAIDGLGYPAINGLGYPAITGLGYAAIHAIIWLSSHQ